MKKRLRLSGGYWSKLQHNIVLFFFFFSGGFCQSSALCRSRGGVPLQHAVRVSPVGSDLQTGQDPGAVLGRTPAYGDDSAGPDLPGPQYPTNMIQMLLLLMYFFI